MIRSCLLATCVAVASGLASMSGAQAFDPPTAAEFFGRFNVPADVDIQVEDDGGVLISAPPGYDGYVIFTLREDEVPEPGHRSVSVDVTLVEDGGGWPDALVGFGQVQGYQEGSPREPYSVGVVSPQDGGTLRLGQFTGTGYAIGQVLGSGNMGVGATVRLTMREQGGSLEFMVANGGTTQASMGNDLISAGMAGDTRIGFILVSGGTYRVSGLEVEATQ